MGHNEEQKELPNMPERTPLGKKALELLTAKQDLEISQKEVIRLKEELVAEFLKIGEKKIKVAGYTFSYNHLERDQIKIKAE